MAWQATTLQTQASEEKIPEIVTIPKMLTVF